MKKEFRVLNHVMETDGFVIAGIGAFKLEGYSVVMSVSLDYLKRAVKIIEELHKGEKDIGVDIAVCDDYPLVIGKYDKEKGEMSGIAIASRIK